MHRYEELEKLYYKKKKIFYFSIFLVFITLSALGYFLYKNFNKSINQKINITPHKKTEINQTKPKTNKIQNLQKKEVKKEIKKEQKISQTKEKNTSNQAKEFKLEFILPDIAKIKEPRERHYKVAKKTPKTTKKSKTSNLEVVNASNVKLQVQKVDINKLINSYNQNPNYDLALAISKEYLNRNEIKNAQIWALKANAMDPERVDSWIQFADILLKQGKKEKARQILGVYIDSYGENEEINRKLRSINE